LHTLNTKTNNYKTCLQTIAHTSEQAFGKLQRIPKFNNHINEMRKSFFLCLLFTSLYSLTAFGNQPDSAYVFSYSNDNRPNGLHFAWSVDKSDWHAIGSEYSYLKCDYGRWGAEKKMFSPFLFQGIDGLWHCIWSLNNKDEVFAHASSKDLIQWGRQSYPNAMAGANCLKPEIVYNQATRDYTIFWTSIHGVETKAFSTTTKDFKTYTAAKNRALSDLKSQRTEVLIAGNTETGVVNKVPWTIIDGLIKTQQISIYKQQLYSENSKKDAERYNALKQVDAKISVNNPGTKKISDLLLGIFFEDINYAADGGLYAELIQNRGFEYALSDKEGNDKSWNSTKAWSKNGANASFIIDTTAAIHPNNKHYAVLKIDQIGGGLVNEGFDGITLKAGEKYDFSVFARSIDAKNEKLLVRLIGNKGEVYGETTIKSVSGNWKKYATTLIAKEKAADARLEIIPQATGSVALDMISLFPQKTFMNRKNGLRSDLAQTIADIKPRFMRFPGGCVAHGDGLGNIYRWKNTIGPLEARKPQRNLWGYHQSAGLGYFEFFQFCEDMGAAPLPVLAAGVPCQNSGTGGAGQQGGVPMCEMDEYVQDMLDLIEYANGPVTSKWGKLRAEAGHPKPFNLKYIGIGNEDLITDIFEERFTMIFNAIKSKHPEITVIGTVGPFYEGTDYREGWDIASKLGVPMVDEHYYESPAWFINNQEFYDNYDRSKSKVYLGEYASWDNTLYNALAEAAYMTSLERNADVVSMASYAPLLANEKHTQWRPDLIYFNNEEVKLTPNYFVQKAFGQNAGDEYIPTLVTLSDKQDGVKKRIAVSVVRDSKSKDLMVKLVNLLPVVVNSTIDLKGLGINPDTEALKTVLQGNPDDKNVKSQETNCRVSETLTVELPAYSFTVFRIKQASR
jgi:alpha-L-arabinofuranosidase